MGRGKRLNESERAKIEVLAEYGLSAAEIAKKIKRSTHVVNNFLKLAKNYGQNRNAGRKPTVSERDKREIYRLATKKGASSSTIKAELKLKVTARHVRRILRSNKNLKYSKDKKKPMLKPKDLKARLAFAHKYLEWTDEWKQVLFSDEKKFTLDGPDGSRCSWKDKRAEKKVAETRHSGGGSLMVWAAFGYLGATELAYIHRKSNSEDYQAILARDEMVLYLFGQETRKHKISSRIRA